MSRKTRQDAADPYDVAAGSEVTPGQAEPPGLVGKKVVGARR
ncbi:MAG TPA: hypothetical protein VI248_08080 [Kineosporiaceae bacterium]